MHDATALSDLDFYTAYLHFWRRLSPSSCPFTTKPHSGILRRPKLITEDVFQRPEGTFFPCLLDSGPNPPEGFAFACAGSLRDENQILPSVNGEPVQSRMVRRQGRQGRQFQDFARVSIRQLGPCGYLSANCET